MTATTRRGPYRSGIERRRQIVETAWEVFARRGYGGASLREIAGVVGVTPAAINRHFGSKEELLIAVLERWGADTAALATRVEMGQGLRYFAVLPRLMQYHVEHPGLIELFLTLCTEATDPTHPGRAWVAERYATIVATGVGHLRAAMDEGPVRELVAGAATAEIRTLFAVMDGLELQWTVLPELDLVGLFSAAFADILDRWGVQRGELLPDAPEPTPVRSAPVPPSVPEIEVDGGPPAAQRGPYRRGAERRADIITAATRLFAQRGYLCTPLSEIAGAVGVSKAALLRHFGSKDGLLFAILDGWDDESASMRALRAESGLAYFDALIGVMGRHAERPGLVDLLLTLTTEASDPAHPARAWVARRYDRITDEAGSALRAAIATGDLLPMSDARIDLEARLLFAVMDGLELQWIADPELDLGELFRRYCSAAVSRWRGQRGATIPR
ncbi:MAG: TetR/AcrR family transcriptional regulator [Microbacteriaceae bacterium]|nr:TetR/AcrR family transcriptional regulator [Microbacteriaceae bacterium]MCL2795003.1 TetR/AcrR family transcriptional regulator [Microbacteriaceae bacterium]